MNEIFNNNGYGYVDLGLPSKTLWATCNVGASKPSDYGLYFQWGSVRGFTKGQIGRDKAFSWPTYKWSIDGIDSNFSKYNTADETLDLEDDAANIHMGGDWHMPTPTQIRELINETDNTWTTQDGVNGRLFTSKNNGKSIFIPAAGYAWGGSLYDSGGEADVWSSTLKASNVNYGRHLSFDSYNVNLSNDYRYCGFSVRGVLDGSLGHKHFEPFQKVLIKEWLNSKSLWLPALYSHYNAENNRHYIIGGKWAKNEDIMPYEGNEYKVGKSAKNDRNKVYDSMDLDLPSGTKWATMNVGASKPSDFGLYFQWGDTQGYTSDQVGKDKHFSSNLNDYKFALNSCFAKYVTKGTTLDLEDDAAHVNMGGDWHMPTPSQIKELVDNTINTWTTKDGVNGRLFTSKKDSSKSIFIPAAGFACDGEVLYSGDFGGVWSSVLLRGSADYGQYLGFNSYYVGLCYSSRCYGFSVRGVIG